jgi:hypothetical protein
MTKEDLVNAFLKGVGRRPTSFLFRWNPSFKEPFKFDLLEVSKCETDGGVVTPTMSQHRRSLHAGHKIISPKHYGLFDLLKVQLRVIQ